MANNPRNYPETMASPESGRPMVRGEKLVPLIVNGRTFQYRQPGWWCSLDDPSDLEGQLVDGDNLIAEMARRTAQAMAEGEIFTPLLIRAIRISCGLSQREAGEFFGTGEKSFEKYECGQIRPSEPTKRLLRLAMQGKLPTKGKLSSIISMPENLPAGLILKTIHEAQLDRLFAPMFATAKLDARTPEPIETGAMTESVVLGRGGPQRRK